MTQQNPIVPTLNWINPESGQTDLSVPIAPAQFDANNSASTMGEMKKLQDPEKFSRARFSFRLYKR